MTKSFHTYNHNLTERSRDLRKNSTLSEVLLWNHLKGRQLLGYKFRRQVPINNYIVDFYCRKLCLGLEIDGITHDYKIKYDQAREQKLNSLGVQVLHIPDGDVKKNVQMVVQHIVDWIEKKITQIQ